jgi:hypothetical protein
MQRDGARVASYPKKRLENQLRLRDAYHTRADLVHHEVERPEVVDQHTHTLEATAAELLRYRIHLPYLGAEFIDRHFCGGRGPHLTS